MLERIRENSLEQLEREQHLLMGAVEGMAEGVALFDNRGQLAFCNEQFRKLNPELAPYLTPGASYEEMLRHFLKNGRVLDAAGRETEFLEERLAAHREPGKPILSRRMGGQWLLLKEERGADGSTLVISMDLTKFKHHEVELQRAKEAAERASNFKSDFLARMSHELRTPLNAIIGFSEILNSELFGPLGSAKYREYAHDILRSGQHLVALINDILDLSKIEAGKYDLQLEPVDLGAVVRQAERLVKGQTEKKRICLRCSVTEGLPPVYADERAIRQILLNLLSNAVKFTPEGGIIHLRLSRDRHGDVRLSVTDNGIGIPQDKLRSVLTPFAQLAAKDRADGGVGLGLPIVSSLVRLHGGTLEVKSRHGKWTRISARFPKQCIIDAASEQVAS